MSKMNSLSTGFQPVPKPKTGWKPAPLVIPGSPHLRQTIGPKRDLEIRR
jgi:hypothetical protein